VKYITLLCIIMKTIYIDYPTDLSFKTKKTFTNNEERTKYLHQVLRKRKVESPSHDYTDYVVEDITEYSCLQELWVVGS
jgi:hypothetical protein